ncbi:2-succinyl-5-enolpyruvyl-6-hydroxy-3-cyclohexene-1-carboxylic-acid synthase [Lutimonas saemankumensis]|uniref:2-succinyl-5-enolpyruvyl-6-hydroxy-3- cyclohexene-1-carboxylic-acid synthase n=1 Tax=Lutimonas saemankumensis TaxID=483016 RepID=UPI001CD7D3AC|nr:2-succinyl-5-enolpyruvyl-6-hydroxy-3-cyclohexene-1-carboxylic-acid synthase [Lutimonas saemankumensis]MCA0933831.1 2-succinyl-5-enolpyruvyl-6-hydroxy-3-cyclohexene-1-carboxylic-acid synthase [Lutimonas saemankumensis]
MPKYPKKKLAQLIIQACVQNDIEQVVISPGSRNAPLTLGFVNHPEVNTFSIVDERCAAFFALGIAQKRRKTVAILCTSGSALLNYYPAIAEAYYSRIPLLIISADRPKRLIDIGDGQTIRQEGVFGHHIFYQAGLEEPEEYQNESASMDILAENAVKIKEALKIAQAEQGPVHLNVPLDEPLYETSESLKEFKHLLVEEETGDKNSLLDEVPLSVEALEEFSNIWNNSSKKLVLVGCSDPDELLQTQISHLVKDPSVVVLTETTSNLRNPLFINNIDQLIFPLEGYEFEKFQPEILLTLGGMVVSKKVKQLLRNYKPDHHWHVDGRQALDTFLCLTHHFKISPQLFFSQFFFLTKNKESDFQNKWLELKKKRKELHAKFLDDAPYSDLKVFEKVFDSLPFGTNLQLSNSSIIRYSQLFDFDSDKSIFCNRGASGIDGSTSTALGSAIVTEEQTVFITGDISFFYDSNALWNNYIPRNFRIIVINNGGGGIFKIIPGPKASGALDYFETTHSLNASKLCEMFEFSYYSAHTTDELEAVLQDFYGPSDKPSLLEIFTFKEDNDSVLRTYFKSI